MKRMLWMMAMAGLALGGCHSPNFLDQQYAVDRANLPAKPLPNNPPAPEPVNIVNDAPTVDNIPPVREVITGTWEFTTPRTVTRVDRQTGDLSQSSIYMGRPGPADKPFLVITVSPTADKFEDNPEYEITSTRSYILNGNIAKEQVGRIHGAGFCDLVVRKPGGNGDFVHAIAIAKTNDERKVALDILGSITWKPNTAETQPNP